MKITGQQPGVVADLDRPRAEASRARGAGVESGPGTDRVALSPEARRLAELRAGVGDPMEVDQARVDDLRARIAAGAYDPSPESIAQAMLREMLANSRS